MKKIIFIQHNSTVRSNQSFDNSVNNSSLNGHVRQTKRNTFYDSDYFWNTVRQSLQQQNIPFEVYTNDKPSNTLRGIKIIRGDKIKPFNSVKEAVKPFSKTKIKAMKPLLEIAKKYYGFKLGTPNGFNGAVRFITNSKNQN